MNESLWRQLLPGAIGASFALALAGQPALGASFEMDKIETPDLRLLYFDPTETYLTPHIARSFHNSLEFQKRMFGWWPWEKTTVLLKDFTDYGNASAGSSPRNVVVIDIAPTRRAFETFTSAERMYTYMNHELIHVSTTDVWNKRDAFWRAFFHGKPAPQQEHPETILYNFLASPRLNSPRWLLEGTAVFYETWMGGGIGRAQGAYDEMVFRAMVRDDAYFYTPLGLASEGQEIDFQVVANAYLYGTRFINYLALTYSPGDVTEWLRRSPDSRRYYSVQFEHVFGKPLNAAWRDWIVWEHDFQRKNLAQLEKFPATPTKRLTKQALGSISRTYVDPKTGNIIGAFRYPGILGHVGELDIKTGKIKRFANLKGDMLYRVTALAYDPQSNKAWYTEDNNALRDLIELDIATGRTRMLIRDGRIGELVYNRHDKSLWGVRHLNGLVTLVRMAPPYTGWNQIHTWPYGETLYDIDLSPDGALLSGSLDHIDGHGTLEVFRLDELLAGKAQSTHSFDFGQATPEGFVFAPDGKALYGSSYYTGVSNIFRYDLETKKIDAMSNAVTGYFRPMPRADGSLVVLEYTGQGFVPSVIETPKPLEDLGTVAYLGGEVATAHPEVKTWGVGSPAKVNLAGIPTRKGKYRPWRELQLATTYPVVEGYKDSIGFGWHFNIEDPMQFARLKITASYSPDSALRKSERWHGRIEYGGIFWHAAYRHNGADFYDLFGPTKRSRKGDAFLAGYRRSLIYDPPRELTVTADAAHYVGLDTLPGNQNVLSNVKNIVSGTLALRYSNEQKSLGAVDHENGWRFDVEGSSDYARHRGYPKLRGGLDFGFPVFAHSSLWAYSSAGIAGGPSASSLASFYFGGFGNNYVDNGEVKRYRQAFAFPGFDIDEIAARRFAKTVVEWNLPPVRFRHAGLPSLYLSWVRPAVFAGALWADPGKPSDRVATNLGAQLDFHFTLAHRLPMTLSVGHAAGFLDGRRRGNETMVSLKVL